MNGIKNLVKEMPESHREKMIVCEPGSVQSKETCQRLDLRLLSLQDCEKEISAICKHIVYNILTASIMI